MSQKRKTLKQKLRCQIRTLKSQLTSTKRKLDQERAMTDVKWLLTTTEMQAATPTYRSLAS